MRISNLLSAACAAAFLTGSGAVHAQDNPAQAAARAALMQKMNELDAQQNQPVIAAPVTPSPAITTPAETQTAPAVIVIAESGPTNLTVAAVPGSNPTNLTVTASPSTLTIDTKSPIVVTPSGVMPPPVVPADNSGFFTPVPPPSNPEGAQAAPQQQMPNPNSQPKFEPNPPSKLAKPLKSDKPSTTHLLNAPTPATVVKTPPSGNANYPGKTLGLPPYVPPPPPVSAKKEAELQALLAKYMADQMNPDEYQKARAAILAEP